MRMDSRRTRLTAITVGALTAITLALGTSPASADGTYSGLPYIHGTGDYTNDLGDEGTLSTSTNTPSNAVCVWQEILAADNKLDFSEVDGYFGTKTESATKNWQSAHNLSPDGVVGKDTFGNADNRLSFNSGSSADGQYLSMLYNGSSFQMQFTRNTDGNWGFWDAFGTHHLASYNYDDC
jgi:peptidoglycan hydrolase-like protein with peptidoglycan-binding domain